MKLSIITINLDNRKGFKKTADSVLAQTSLEFEWIIIDGGSSDGSVDEIKIAQEKWSVSHGFENIYWVSERDTGIYNAMNKGVHVAKGEYVLMLNSGDYFVDESVISKVIPELDDDFLMVKQWRHGEKALSVEFPGGVIDEGEDPLNAACRELLEETGYEAGKMTKLAAFNPNPALFSNHVHVYLAEDLEKTSEQALDDDEFVNYFRMPKSEVMAKMGSPEMPHGLMLSALGLYLANNRK